MFIWEVGTQRKLVADFLARCATLKDIHFERKRGFFKDTFHVCGKDADEIDDVFLHWINGCGNLKVPK